MKIIGLETIQIAEFSNLVWVRLHTDEGLIGLGETFRNPQAIVAYIHETCAPYLIGKDPRRRTALTEGLRRDVGNAFKGFPTRSVEVRGNAAVDIALWDLWGQAAGQPILALLGGKMRDGIRMYNTCANSAYNNVARPGGNQQVFGRDTPAPDAIGPEEDLLLQVYEPRRLARELLEAGITAMKIWPFDVAAIRNKGASIGAAELKDALWPIEEIRAEVGDAMDILIELHGLWKLPPALKIAKALADYDVFWLEDPLALDNFADLETYQREAPAMVAASENLGTVPWFREAFMRGAIDVAIFDMAWVGGITEGQRVTHLADAFDRTIAPHDCTGPVTLIANTHLLAHAPNALLAETVRSHLTGFYKAVMTELPRVESGMIYPLEGPGLGAGLNADVLARGDLTRKVSGTLASE
ncbi:mandelate racemase/muconate lactonizing enzyme family protein [Jiella pacifica]|uniref:Mandelate racemase/muconate lactonizing enzyme C-terminal domain-containing protein n=1 Tax=Jiella pacifica TaxID=2696469 RepID=A0A6N9T5V1_9HYPH|nr:mandelate racemase/muconate lactonizing enzyme family protein [Jiella pacifica]NDW05952.1 hypothetical protein [Jiella pacifica]